MKQTIVLATYGVTVEHRHRDCIDALKARGTLVLEMRASSQIDIARSVLACAALDHGADVAFFIDHDTTFDPADVEAVAEAARETGGVVGVPYSTRRLGGSLVGGIDSAKYEEVTFFEGGGLYEAAAVIGMGFTAIHRSVFEKFDALPEYPVLRCNEGMVRPYFQKIVRDGYWYHEDSSFCTVARELGVSMMVDTRYRLKHWGLHGFGIEDCRLKPRDEPTVKLRLRAGHT